MSLIKRLTLFRPIVSVSAQRMTFATSSVAFEFHVLSKAQRKIRSETKKKQNRARQLAKLDALEKVDPVLGRADNPFITRIRAEVTEKDVLGKGYDFEEVEKLIYGINQARLSKLENDYVRSVSNSQTETIKEVVIRVLSMRNSNNQDRKNLAVAFARKEFERFPGDTGSSEVQAAVQTLKLYFLMDHIRQNPKDLDKIRNARMLAQQRQRILRYLKRDDPQRYFWAIRKLGLTDEAVHMEFNFDKRYMQEYEIWPGRVLVKESKKQIEEKRRERRKAKKAMRLAIIQDGVGESANKTV
ncbi:hypothetical protein LJB42_003699 [Komagataella kurtzmanii]|nr:hypothetical protein LJB42_003699 [Komagataella kurtzmanii]